MDAALIAKCADPSLPPRYRGTVHFGRRFRRSIRRHREG